MYGCMDGFMHACMHACMYVCIYVWMDVCMNAWMDGWMNGYMHVCMYVCMKKPLLRRMNYYELFRDTHREKAPSNKTPALTKSTNMVIWGVGTSN